MVKRSLLVGEISETSPLTMARMTPTSPAVRLRGSVKQTRSRRAGRVTGSQVRSCMYQIAQKRWIAASSAITPGLSGTFQTLNDMTQGSANGNRLGNQVRFMELEYTLIPHLNADSADAVRIVLFRDTQPEGSTPTVAELLCSSTVGSCFNPDFVGNQAQPRFAILSNHLVHMSQASGTNQDVVGPVVARKVRLGFTTTYTGNAGTVSDIQTNGLFFFLSSSGANATVNLSYCLKYIDL